MVSSNKQIRGATCCAVVFDDGSVGLVVSAPDEEDDDAEESAIGVVVLDDGDVTNLIDHLREAQQTARELRAAGPDARPNCATKGDS